MSRLKCKFNFVDLMFKTLCWCSITYKIMNPLITEQPRSPIIWNPCRSRTLLCLIFLFHSLLPQFYLPRQNHLRLPRIKTPRAVSHLWAWVQRLLLFLKCPHLQSHPSESRTFRNHRALGGTLGNIVLLIYMGTHIFHKHIHICVYVFIRVYVQKLWVHP